MALIYESWVPDGEGQSRKAYLRSDSPAGKSAIRTAVWIEEQQADPKVCMVTRSRTDRQSPTERILWQRPGYIDPCNE